MSIKIISFIFILIIIILIIIIYNKWIIIHSNNITDFNKLLNKNINVIAINNFYPKHLCDILLNRIKDIIHKNKIKEWKYSENKSHDVHICQIPLSNVLNELSTPKDYFEQEIYNLYNGIISPMMYFKRIIDKNIYNDKQKKSNIEIGVDKELISRFPKYNNYKNSFQEGIIRIYKSDGSDGGLWHTDIDETGFYDDYNIFALNIYLNVPNNGGELQIQNKKFRPNKGTMIIFDPSYYHCVVKYNNTNNINITNNIDIISNNRISIQSFLLYNKKNGEIMIRA